MNASLVNAILTGFILAYVFTAVIFMVKQKQGASFVESFDKAILRGGWFFAFVSCLSFLGVMSGSLTPSLI